MIKFRRPYLDVKTPSRTAWRENKWLYMLLGVFILAGVVLGVLILSDPMITHWRIGHEFLDGNVRNVASPSRSVGTFIFSRFLEFAFGLLLVFIFCLSKWSWWLTFPYLSFRVLNVMINLFWIIDRYGFFRAFAFFFFYTIIFIALVVLFALACVFIIKRCQIIRKFGFRHGFRWPEVKRPVVMIVVSLFAIAFIEWLLYFLILGRMIFIL